MTGRMKEGKEKGSEQEMLMVGGEGLDGRGMVVVEGQKKHSQT